MTETCEQAGQDRETPGVPLAPYELVSLDNILISYQTYLLRPVPMTEQEEQHFTHILNIRRRIGRLIRPGMAVGNELIELNEGELETITAALKMLSELVSLFFTQIKV